MARPKSPKSSTHSSQPTHTSRASPPSSSSTRAIPLGIALVAIGAAVAFALSPASRDPAASKTGATLVTPLAPSIVENSEGFLDKSYRDKMLWGSYRPQVYFGLRPRLPKSLITGLAWMHPETGQIRHSAKDDDHLQSFGWERHDGESFGSQGIEDYPLSIATDFVKRIDPDTGRTDWGSRVFSTNAAVKRAQSTSTRKSASDSVTFLMFYLADEAGSALSVDTTADGLLRVRGSGDGLGNYTVTIQAKTEDSEAPLVLSERDLSLTYYTMHTEHFHNITEQLGTRGRALGELGVQNMVVVRLQARTRTAVLDVAYTSNDDHKPLSGNTFSFALMDASLRFDRRFEDTFKLEAQGHNETVVKVARAALSNMLGGMGYFYGHSMVNTEERQRKDRRAVPSWDAPLFTAVPSRSFFPRGFMWDEGFHQLLVVRWSREITMDVLSHWFSLINADGWIAREQIRGLEAESRVPSEFIVQRNDSANPPTLFLPLLHMVETLAEQPVREQQRERRFFGAILPHLRAWYSWFATTQAGRVPGTYRWRGRDATTARELNPKTLTSGLDDYPRASHPTDDERHVDLYVWMAMASNAMHQLSRAAGTPDTRFAETYTQLSNETTLARLHWSDIHGQFCDYGLHTSRARLVNVVKKRPGNKGSEVVKERVLGKRASTGEEIQPKLRLVPELGYVSLFPLLARLLPPTSARLELMLTTLHNTSELWSPYGLRSLSPQSPFHMRHNTQHDAPYWRGAIWINLNYMAISALRHYAQHPDSSPETASLAQLLYTQLRSSVADNLIREYTRSGYVWENYSASTGRGQGTKPFTGWSALLVLILSE